MYGTQYHVPTTQFLRGVHFQGFKRLFTCGIDVHFEDGRPRVLLQAGVFGAICNGLRRHAPASRGVGRLLKALKDTRQPGATSCTANRGCGVVVLFRVFGIA